MGLLSTKRVASVLVAGVGALATVGVRWHGRRLGGVYQPDRRGRLAAGAGSDESGRLSSSAAAAPALVERSPTRATAAARRSPRSALTPLRSRPPPRGVRHRRRSEHDADQQHQNQRRRLDRRRGHSGCAGRRRGPRQHSRPAAPRPVRWAPCLPESPLRTTARRRRPTISSAER